MLLLTLPLLGSPTLAGLGGRLLTDFAGAGLDLQWFSVDDGVMGGRSRGSFRVERGLLAFSGSLSTDGGGFASLRTRPTALALDDAVGIRLRVRGDGRVYPLRLQQAASDRQPEVSYRATFATERDTWQVIHLPFRAFVPMWRGRTLDLPPVEPARIEGLGFMIADKVDGAFRLEVDSIHACPPFALESLRGQQRLLVVLAPRADDARLRAQLDGVKRTEGEFQDRDMLLIVLLDDGVSFAGSRPLEAGEVANLRARFDVAPGIFAALLIGKDGGVKRRADEPLDPAAVYAQVDTMPMRRAELADR